MLAAVVIFTAVLFRAARSCFRRGSAFVAAPWCLTVFCRRHLRGHRHSAQPARHRSSSEKSSEKSSENGGLLPAKAFSGDVATRWEAAPARAGVYGT